MLVLARISAEWLTAIGGLGAFVATAVLAGVAVKQMQAARAQVDVTRKTAHDDAEAMTKQIDASIAQSDAIREAARVFVQPRVLGYAAGVAIRGPDTYRDGGNEEIGFPYRIVNEGGGIALNIVHGIELDGVEHLFGGGMETAALGAGFSSPPPDSDLGGFRPLVVVVREDELPSNWATLPRSYIVRFTNVLGERYETRTPLDPTQPHTFERTDSGR
jgi:hypothetical protein